jgi:TolB-like protein
LSAVASAKAEKSLVVLPLENLSPDPENASFAEGMHAEIVSTLQLIPELRVVSRNAALAFKNSSAPIAEIAQKLGVANVISGSVRREKNKVRIQLELRRANDDVLLWALPKGDRDAGNALAIQTEIAEQVARALQTRDLKGGFSTLAQFMTKNPRAYDLFVKVRATVDRINAADRVPVVAQCKAILELDPNFMLAANLLSTSLSQLAGSAPNTKERLSFVAEAKRWADAASRMAPGGAGDGALSYYYTYVEQDGLRGLAFAENTIRALPNWAAGYNNAGHACVLLGRTQDAADFYRRARELDSDALVFAGNWTGALTQLRQRDRVWDIYSAEPALRDVFATFAFRQFVLDGKLPASLDNFSDATRLTWLWRMRRFDEAAAVCAAELGKVTVPGSRQLTLLCLQSDLFHRLGRRVDAEQAAREALAVAQKLQSDSEVGPTQKPGWLASALERNGRADEAIAAALRAVAVTSPESQLGLRWTREINLAGIYAYANRPRECIELLAKLLRVPSGLTVPMVKVDPMWDNVREDAGFKALLADPKNSAPL